MIDVDKCADGWMLFVWMSPRITTSTMLTISMLSSSTHRRQNRHRWYNNDIGHTSIDYRSLWHHLYTWQFYDLITRLFYEILHWGRLTQATLLISLIKSLLLLDELLPRNTRLALASFHEILELSCTTSPYITDLCDSFRRNWIAINHRQSATNAVRSTLHASPFPPTANEWHAACKIKT